MNNKTFSLDNVNIKDNFWSYYQKLIRDVVLPYEWEALNDRIPDAEPSYAISNLKIAAGLQEGEHKSFPFQDSDLAKWLEAVAYSLHTNPDSELEKIADDTIEMVRKAQQPDGYLNSFFTIKGERWTNLFECHELYTAGHFIEAGVAWYEATGKRNLLDIVCRLADYIDSVFGAEDKKLHGYDGHQEIELALVRLYEVTGEKRYLKLARYFLEERGREPYYFSTEWEKRGKKSHFPENAFKDPNNDREYMQTHLPVKQQTVAVGHAVRLVYMLTSMAGVAMITKDDDMLKACKALWKNIVTRQMYITGGIGATYLGEAFTFDYDLPNDTAYAETCASVGLVFFAQKMLEIENNREYADVIERVLFNILVGSMARDGKHFFYVNPLEVFPEASEKDPGKRHVKAVRQKWFGCSCCPPNLARLLTSLGKYIYTCNDNTLFVHQFIGSEVSVDTLQGKLVINQTSHYPWDGKIQFKFALEQNIDYMLAIRIPGWCRTASIDINDLNQEQVKLAEDGYVKIMRNWEDGDTVNLSFEMPIEFMEANPLVRADAGKIAIQRGPVIYCLEEIDNGQNISAISISPDTKLSIAEDKSIAGGTWIIRGSGFCNDTKEWGDALYGSVRKTQRNIDFTAIPYYLWGNRESGEMAVWIRKA